MQDITEAEMFDYLDCLRGSGITNMFGAAPFLEEEFDLDTKTAREVLSKWMKNFKNK